ncbi:MAG: glycosyltransferase [Propionivibrio sp.]|uniref:glycosyltransferase n=1 Tax=Propionivibrio sp. TaxID=2212460 RepID=UPI001A3DE5D2|nr:glycosyltransferase [Propionivibrio sp.]MBL8414923.1 glycosyltransferase [Propionivibrio sp.]
MNQPTVTVIIPVRNGVSVLPDCLTALRQQSYPSDKLEVIVIDDESTDHTPSLVEAEIGAWAQHGSSPSLRLIRKTWGGAGAARNRGVQEALGEVVLFTDADCEPTLTWVEEMMKPLADPEVQAVAGGYLTKQKSSVARLAQTEFEDRYRYVVRHRFIDIAFTHSCAVRRTAFLATQGFDERIPNNGDDLELSYRLAKHGHRIVFAPKGLVYHQHPATWGEYIKKKIGRGYWRTLIFKRYPAKLVRDSYTPQTLKLQILLAGLAPLLTLLAIAGPSWAGVAAIIAWLVLFCSTIPFVLRMNGSLLLRLLAPIFLIVQATSIGWGTFLGLFGNIEDYVIGGKKAEGAHA